MPIVILHDAPGVAANMAGNVGQYAAQEDAFRRDQQRQQMDMAWRGQDFSQDQALWQRGMTERQLALNEQDRGFDRWRQSQDLGIRADQNRMMADYRNANIGLGYDRMAATGEQRALDRDARLDLLNRKLTAGQATREDVQQHQLLMQDKRNEVARQRADEQAVHNSVMEALRARDMAMRSGQFNDELTRKAILQQHLAAKAAAELKIRMAEAEKRSRIERYQDTGDIEQRLDGLYRAYNATIQSMQSMSVPPSSPAPGTFQAPQMQPAGPGRIMGATFRSRLDPSKQYTMEDIQHTAQSRGMTVQQVIQRYGLVEEM